METYLRRCGASHLLRYLSTENTSLSSRFGLHTSSGMSPQRTPPCPPAHWPPALPHTSSGMSPQRTSPCPLALAPTPPQVCLHREHLPVLPLWPPSLAKPPFPLVSIRAECGCRARDYPLPTFLFHLPFSWGDGFSFYEDILFGHCCKIFVKSSTTRIKYIYQKCLY